MTSYRSVLASARRKLADAGIETAALDARLLLRAASDLDAAALIAREAEEAPRLAMAAFDSYVSRRLAREPVARILGEKEFHGLPFRVTAATLVPRPETEILVDAVIAQARASFPAQIGICDLGTGSGAILISLLVELPEARGVAVDISEMALDIARENAERLGVASRISFHRGDFEEAPPGPFDIVVSNPPYVRSNGIGALDPEVRVYDPRIALDGGPDGLDAYRAILAHAGGVLAPRGLLALEIGYDQADAVSSLCRAAGLGTVLVHADLSGIGRVVMARAAGTSWEERRKNRLENSESRASFRLANQ